MGPNAVNSDPDSSSHTLLHREIIWKAPWLNFDAKNNQETKNIGLEKKMAGSNG